MANIFTFRDSNLNVFLFSKVGVEPNGNSLTILSLLARLGKDPWVEAADWARQPKDTAVRLLADSISQMPSNQKALGDARMTAMRLIDLLPTRDTSTKTASAPPGHRSAMSKERLLMFVGIIVFLAFAMWQSLGPKLDIGGTREVNPVTTSTK